MLGWLFKMLKAIPDCPSKKEDPEAYEAAFERKAGVARGRVAVPVPGRAITRDGKLQPFKGGIMKVWKACQCRSFRLPCTIFGFQFFRIDGGHGQKPLRRGLFNRVGLVVVRPLSPPRFRLICCSKVQALLEEPSPEVGVFLSTE